MHPPMLIQQVQRILLQPRQAWAEIDGESADVASLYTGYLMVLAAIPAICGFIGMSLVGFGGFGVTLRIPVLAGLANMVVSYGLSLAGVYALSLVINALAPTFGGRKDPIQALKVAVYASTAALLGGVFSLLPAMAMLGVLAALYSVFLLYAGLPVLMRSAPEKSVAYTAVVVVAAMAVGVVIGAVSTLFMPDAGSLASRGDAADVSIQTPGGTVNLDAAGIEAATKKLEEATRQMEQAQKSQDSAAMAAAAEQAATAAAGLLGSGKSVAGDQLRAALPAQLGGLARKDVDVQDRGTVGLSSSHVSAYYGAGHQQVRLEILDVGALGSMAALAMSLGQGEREDATQAEKTWREGGRTLHQSYQKDGSRAEFKAVLKNGLVVSLEAEKLAITDLRALMGQVDLARLEGLARPGQ